MNLPGLRIPLFRNQKTPKVSGWQDIQSEPPFDPGDNVGLRLDHLTDLDLDCAEAVAVAAQVIEGTCSFGRPTGAGHYLFDVADAKPEVFKDVDGSTLLEIRRGAGQYTVIPPSKVPRKSDPLTIDELIWFSELAPRVVTASALRLVACVIASASLVIRHWPSGGRHNGLLALAGFLARYRVDQTFALAILEEITRQAEGQVRSECATSVRDTYASLEAGNKTTGAGELERWLGAAVVRRLRDYFQDTSASDESDGELKTRIKNRERITREVRRELDAEERLVVEPPASLTLTERLAQPRTEIAWRIDGWMPVDARVMLSAQFKAGKTTLVQNVIRSLVDGDRFLERSSVTPIAGQGLFEGRLALLDFEMSERQLIAWFRDQHIRSTDRVVVLPMRGAASSFDIRIAEIRAQWADRLRQQQVKLLVVDCIRPIMDALGLNEHTDAGLLLTAFDTLLKDADIPEAIVVHHMGHNGERARGDSRLRDWPDVEWRLVRQDDDPASDRFISAFGRDVEVEESQLAFDKSTRRLRLEGGNRSDAKADSAVPAVLDVLRQAGEPLSKNLIEKRLSISDHSRAAIRKAIGVALRDGLLSEDTGGQGGGVRYAIREQDEPAPGPTGGNDAPPF